MPIVIPALLLAASVSLPPGSLQDYLRQAGKPPADYLLSKVAAHRIVLVGENHWQRADAELISAVVPELRRRNVALAMEFFPAASQGDIDLLITSPEWDEKRANRVMRAGDWPYLQYREILHEAWRANRGAPPLLKVIALGPPDDWREKGIRYDAFMADLVRGYAADDQHPVLVYCGLHHAFTRFLQIERLKKGRPSEFMERMGNILWRQFGADVFLVALHRPDGCGGWEEPFAKLCAPLGGTIDCAGSRNGGTPVGFDILGSPIAETKLDGGSFYSIGHPLLRMADLFDGYVWQGPVDEARMVELIPLAEYAPDDAENGTGRAEWQKRGDDLADPKKRASWANLPVWRATCAPTETAASAQPQD